MMMPPLPGGRYGGFLIDWKTGDGQQPAPEYNTHQQKQWKVMMAVKIMEVVMKVKESMVAMKPTTMATIVTSLTREERQLATIATSCFRHKQTWGFIEPKCAIGQRLSLWHHHVGQKGSACKKTC
jgi:hypothetical protein